MSRRCQHDPRNPRTRLRCAIPANLPALLLSAIERCDRVVLRRGEFPELGSGRGQKRFAFTSGGRERRSQRLEAISLVLQSVLLHTDLVTLRSGRRRRDNSCAAVTEDQIARETGLHLARVRRARRDLVDAGYLTKAQQPRRSYIDAAGAMAWKAYAGVCQVTATLFVRLGISVRVLEDQRRQKRLLDETGPAPIIDIRARRARQQLVRAQAIAAKRAERYQVDTDAMVKRSAERLERLMRRRE